MNHDIRKFNDVEFAHLFDETGNSLRNLAITKGKEYSGDDDRLANFRRYAAVLELDYKQVLAVYAGKHWDAILSYCKHSKVFSDESIDGRINDLILYLLLLKCMVVEDRAVHFAAKSLANKEVISHE